MRVRPEMIDVWVERAMRTAPPDAVLMRRLEDTCNWITDNPRRYLAFGPYWWVLKDLAQRRFGNHRLRWAGRYMDDDLLRRYRTGDDLRDLGACLIYQAEHNRNLVDAPERHDVEDASGDDTESYTLFDPDLRMGD